MYNTTKQLGYSTSKTALFDGTILTLMSSELLDVTKDTIVDGFNFTWSANGKQSGTLSYQATSSNSPLNTMSDSLIIR